MRFRTLLPTVALLFAVPALAQDKRPAAPPAPVPAPHVKKVFEVADLVAPAPSLDGEKATAAYRANTEKLVKLVTGMVRPYSWTAAGGTGTAEYFDLGTALVVTNTADVLTEIADLLEALRKLGAVSLVYEVRLVRAPAGTFERAGVKPARDTALTAAQLRTLLEAAQADRDASVAQLPRLTVGNGESTTVKCGDTRTFVTGVDVTKLKGQTVCVPRQTAIHLGETVTLKGVLSADQKYVRVEAGAAHARLAGKVELIPVTTQVTPVFEGGSQGPPIPFTQYIEVPDVRKEGAERIAVVPDGGTLVIGSWKQPAEPNGKGKPGPELEVLALATVRVMVDVDEARNQPSPAPRVSAAHKLRNVAAADAAHALTRQFQGASITAEPVSNALLVTADKGTVEQVARAVAQLDKPVPHVIVQAQVIEVPDDFLKDCGLAEGRPGVAVSTQVLSPRETQMLTALLRAAKEKGTCDVLSRPQLQVADNQTGYVNVGQSFPLKSADGKVGFEHLGLALGVTPRVSPDGKSVLLNTEARHASVGTTYQPKTVLVPGGLFPITTFTPVPVFNTQELKSSVMVPFGHTVVTGTVEKRVRGGRTERVQTLVILTPALVRNDEVKPAASWFTK